jgi:hypothetical protein
VRRALITVLILVVSAWLYPTAAGAAQPAAQATRTISDACEHPTSVSVPLGSDDAIGIAQFCPGVRPGARLLIGSDSNLIDSESLYCTMNFLFADSTAQVYVGTAGHCILDGVGEMPPSPPDRVPTAYAFDENIDPYRIGTVVFAVRNDVEDFALIRLDPGVGWNPQVCFFGGPLALNDTTSQGLTLLHHFGQGIGLGDLTPARSAITPNLQDPDRVMAAGVAVQGDSGSPVLDTTGRAIGVMVSIGVSSSLNQIGVLGITRLGPQMAEAGRVLGTHFTLIPAPLIA